MNLYISTEIINFSQEGGWQALSEEEKKKKSGITVREQST